MVMMMDHAMMGAWSNRNFLHLLAPLLSSLEPFKIFSSLSLSLSLSLTYTYTGLI
jgi:hypothetical protein